MSEYGPSIPMESAKSVPFLIIPRSVNSSRRPFVYIPKEVASALDLRLRDRGPADQVAFVITEEMRNQVMLTTIDKVPERYSGPPDSTQGKVLKLYNMARVDEAKKQELLDQLRDETIDGKTYDIRIRSTQSELDDINKALDALLSKGISGGGLARMSSDTADLPDTSSQTNEYYEMLESVNDLTQRYRELEDTVEFLEKAEKEGSITTGSLVIPGYRDELRALRVVLDSMRDQLQTRRVN